jgi:pimeloyl-ACP methyl ester carboxylesterase
MTDPILITLHGGCFTGGSADWDKAQTACLQKCGFDVRQLDFPKDNITETIEYIREYIRAIGTPVYILGRSSGGYLAKVMFEKYPELIKKAVYLAPVFNPELRAQINPQFQSNQEYFFRDADYINTSGFNEVDEILVLARNDENVPKECFSKKQKRYANYIGIRTHKGVTVTTSKRFREIMQNLLHT